MKIFLSYTRSKDQYSKVTTFRERLEAELLIRRPGTKIFQDKENISEGEHFPEVIKDQIDQADLLLTLLSPAWLVSDWCRKEFSFFTRQLSDEKRLHRIMPVLWVETPQVDANSTDPIAKALSSIQYSDWRERRYNNWDDPDNQKSFGKLAESTLSLASSTYQPVAEYDWHLHSPYPHIPNSVAVEVRPRFRSVMYWRISVPQGTTIVAWGHGPSGGGHISMQSTMVVEGGDGEVDGPKFQWFGAGDRLDQGVSAYVVFRYSFPALMGFGLATEPAGPPSRMEIRALNA